MTCETVDLKIPALTGAQIRCGGCASRLCASLAELEGVSSAECDGAAGTVTVCWDTDVTSLDAIERRLLGTSHELAEGYGHIGYRLTGLD